MKKLFLALLLSASTALFAQVSDKQVTATLTSTCSNANTTCDTAGVTVFSQYGDVLGPQVIEVNTANYGLAQITVHGTYSGSTIFFEYSDDSGITWYPNVCVRSDANIQEGSEAIATNATEGFECSVGAATRFRVRQSALSTGGPLVRVILTAGLVEPAPTVALNATVGSTDPCQNPGVLKSSAKITLTSTTAQELVVVSGTTKVYVCGFVATIQGSATTVGTLQFEAGTKTTNGCDTTTTTLTDVFQGNITANVPLLVNYGPGSTIFSTPAAQELCAIATGTTISVKGVVTFVQQ